jgi:hypothetical protein
MKATGLTIALSMFVVALTSRVAAAYPADVSWSGAATGCQLAATTTAHPPSYDYTYGEVDFVTGDTGTFHLVCPVTALSYNEDPTSLFLAYNDQDTSKCQISAVLRYHSLTSGTYGTAATVTATTVASSPYLNDLSAGTGTLDFDSNFYWVDISVTRTDSTVSYCNANAVWLEHLFQ